MDVFASSIKLDIGKIYTYNDLNLPISYGDELKFDYRIMIIKNANEDDYIKSCKVLGYTDDEITDYIQTRQNYYFVSLD